jgi:hypothetical protein
MPYHATHIRFASIVYGKSPGRLSLPFFILGAIAPDSVDTGNLREMARSHFISFTLRINDAKFLRAIGTRNPAKDFEIHSFLMGYHCHLWLDRSFVAFKHKIIEKRSLPRRMRGDMVRRIYRVMHCHDIKNAILLARENDTKGVHGKLEYLRFLDIRRLENLRENIESEMAKSVEGHPVELRLVSPEEHEAFLDGEAAQLVSTAFPAVSTGLCL